MTTMTKNMRRGWLGVGFVVLATASCGFPGLSALVDGGAGDGANDGSSLPFGLELLAGDIGGAGYRNGTGAAARFDAPFGVAIDGAGNLYMADTANSSIRKVTPAGVVTTLAGTSRMTGSADGTGAAARFYLPLGVAVDATGNVYVADTNNFTIRMITPAGVVTTLAGTPESSGSTDGTGAAARFNEPAGVAVDRTGNVYVADQGNHTVRKITPAGVVTTLAGTAGMAGSADGMRAAARFDHPTGVAVDGGGNLYVADKNNHTIRKVTAAGAVTTLSGTAGMSGRTDGPGATASFNFPSGVALDSAGNVYIADTNNCAIRKVTADGTATTLAGGLVGSADGTRAGARFDRPSGVAVDSLGNIHVADQGNDTLRHVTAEGVVTTVAGTPGLSGYVDDRGAAARFYSPSGVAVDGAGNVYVADLNNHTIRAVSPVGVVTTLAGGGVNGSADGIGAAARFYAPSGLAVDGSGNLYVADQFNHTIRKVTADGVVTTVAGTAGISGSADGRGAAARFYFPSGIGVDRAGNVYVADQLNDTIRKITADGMVTTLAGHVGVGDSADGAGSAAGFSSPFGLAVSAAGDVYVTDTNNRTIRKITSDGVVTTLAGFAGRFGSSDGTGSGASFGFPLGVAVDGAGNVYVTDSSNSSIRRITPDGIVMTSAGTAGLAEIVLGPAPQLLSPQGVAVVGDSLVISDSNAILLLRHGAERPVRGSFCRNTFQPRPAR